MNLCKTRGAEARKEDTMNRVFHLGPESDEDLQLMETGALQPDRRA